MRGRVAWWGNTEDGFVVEFDKEMLAWLDGQGTDRKVFVSVSRERTVIILPDDEGSKVRGRVSELSPQHARPQDLYVSGSKPSTFFPDVDLLPFGLTELIFKEEEGCISAELLSDHELAWPNLKLDATTYDAPMLAKDVLQARMISLMACGGTSFRPEHRMPMRLHQMLPEGAWVECMSTAKALVSGGLDA